MSLRLRHPVYFLVAFIAACLSWYAATGKRRASISVRSVKASLTLVNLPGDLILTSGVPDTVILQLRGPLPLISKDKNLIEVYLDLSDAHPGRSAFPIDISSLALPPEIEALSVEPAEIDLELEKLAIRSLPIKAELEGRPAPGFEVGAVRVQPEKVRIQGPEKRIEGMEFLETTPVSIEGAARTMEVEVELALDDPFLRVLASSAPKLRVEILPQQPAEPASPGPAGH